MKKTITFISVLLAVLMVFSVTVSAAGGNGGGTAALTLVSATVGDAALEGAKIAAGSEIALTFSNNVTDASVLAGNIGKIQIKDNAGEVATATVAPGADKTVFLVTLGDLAKGAYTLNIDQSLAAKNGSTLAADVTIAFQVKGDGGGTGTGTGGGNNPLSFVSATADGKDLQGAELAAEGTITITFDRGMTEYQAQNFEQIGIYDADGNKAADVSFTDFTKDDAGNSFTVLSYQGLAAGAYTLKLGKDLKANNTNTLGEDVTISFTVKGAPATDEEPGTGNTNAFRTFIDAIVRFFKNIANFFKNLFN